MLFALLESLPNKILVLGHRCLQDVVFLLPFFLQYDTRLVLPWVFTMILFSSAKLEMGPQLGSQCNSTPFPILVTSNHKSPSYPALLEFARKKRMPCWQRITHLPDCSSLWPWPWLLQSDSLSFLSATPMSSGFWLPLVDIVPSLVESQALYRDSGSRPNKWQLSWSSSGQGHLHSS